MVSTLLRKLPSFGRSCRFDWLTGPIFDKELRVSSRRRRNYALRFLYVLVLAIFVAVVWLAVVEYQGSGTFQQSRMSAAGKQIVSTVVMFQFVAMQILAIIMLSSAISDEIYHRTLGLLMSTSISSLQIVMGKVLSRLLQLVLLLAISLPILAIVRVFGGVPWSYVLASLCITLTAAFFAGSISLLFSIGNRHAYGVIIRTMFVLLVLYLVLPLSIGLAAYYITSNFGLATRLRSVNLPDLVAVLASLNPFSSMMAITKEMMSPSGRPLFYLPLHCAVMLGLSALVLARAVAVVRKVALRQATGLLMPDRPRARGRKAGTDSAAIKRVHGPPVVWKELRAPFIQGADNRNSYIGLAITVAALAFTYWGSADSGTLDEDFTHTSYVMLFVFIGVIVNIVFSATRITTERESQSWMLLLTTPLSDGDILFGKAVSAFRRCLPIWGLLAGHVILFTAVHYIHPVAILHLLMLVAWLTCFITGAGLYFSARFARTTSAVVASFALVVGLWMVGPILAGLAGAMHKPANLFAAYMWTHPMAQASLIMSGAAGVQNANTPWRSLSYSTGTVFRSSREFVDIGTATWILAAIAAIYIVAGLAFFWRAKRLVRRDVF